jgi:hypothetical protein
MDQGYVSLRVVNVSGSTWIRLLHYPFLYQFWIASRLFCSLYEVTGSLSVASAKVSSAKIDVIDSEEVGMSAVFIRYNNNGPRTLPTLTEVSSVCSVSTFTRKCLLCKYEFRTKK